MGKGAARRLWFRARPQDNPVGIAALNWLVDDALQSGTAAYVPGSSVYSETFTLRGPGLHTVRMQALNMRGERSEWMERYYLNEAPVLDEAQTPAAPAAFDIQTPQNITARASDPNGGELIYLAAIAAGHDVAADSSQFRVLGGSETSGTSGVLQSLPLALDIGLGAGDYTLRITVADEHGGAQDVLTRNIALTGSTTQVAPGAPAVYWAAGTTGWSSGDESDAAATAGSAATVLPYNPAGTVVSVSVSVQDRRSVPAASGFTYEWSLNGVVYETTGGDTSAQSSRSLDDGLRAGANTISLVVTNDDGESSARAQRRFYLNTQPESLRITAPTGAQTIQLSEGSRELNFAASGSDSADDSLTYTWQLYRKESDGSWSLVETMGTTTGNGAVLSYTFTQAAGDYQVRVTAQDGYGAAATLESPGSNAVAVLLNGAPVVRFVQPTAGSSGSAVVGQDVDFELEVTDPNLDSVDPASDFRYQWEYQRPDQSSSSNWNALPAGSTVDNTAPYRMKLKTGGFASTATDPYRIRVRVSDAAGGVSTATYALSMAANRLPSLGFTGATPADNARYQLRTAAERSPALNFYTEATDPDGDALSYGWEINGLSVAGETGASLLAQTFASPVSGKSATEIAGMSASERHQVLVTALVNDGINGNVALSRTLRLNVAPQLGSVSAAAAELALGSSLRYSVVAEDPEGDSLSYQWRYRQGTSGDWFYFGTDSSEAYFTAQSSWSAGEYQISVLVSDGEGGSAESSPQSLRVYEVLPVPVMNAASAVSTTGFTVNWNAVAGADGYKLSGSDGTSVDLSSTSYTLSGLSPGTSSFFYVRAMDSTGVKRDSSWSNGREFGTTLAAPSLNSAASDVSTTGFTVSWSAVTGADGYYISWGMGADVTFGFSRVSGTSHTISGLDPGGTYAVRLQATDSTDVHPDSVWVSREFKTALAAPSLNSAASDVSASGLTVSWNAVTGATNYWIKWGPDSNTDAGQGYYTSTSISLSSLSAGTLYYVKVKALADGRESDWSSTETFSTDTLPALAAPSLKSQVNNSISGFTIEWDAVEGADSYEISWGTGSNAQGSTAQVTGTTSYTTSGLSSGTIYYVKVRAKDSTGNRPQSNWSAVEMFGTLTVNTGWFF
ncbi:uncharacterized protein LOC133177994 [Saccostrea echinata]|uniref:uncharacterized protein LOC133177994 n=1 Tax=Saccostrea echinata TaxID=191078 RepID=UPI002A839026|nr:uncharacterized protein LOC133177994 [Saccostrea echinata]